ncbi:hypothetical protein HYH03_011846 [Edaphochlamys debaryana]|uniref:AAA+ ATPase domain-containing protein n=1 Tax=Edaphochlamys debaryana TaxID=47281 RepID=A0A835Y275_9CHLO|nr:hypothetical protein HYH03_011846 [Edaphochlamys debaryana]|eukprot:KAG2489739.1 hypothetical protein HYH03_011846 [Edaphochlamys debaryana]
MEYEPAHAYAPSQGPSQLPTGLHAQQQQQQQQHQAQQGPVFGPSPSKAMETSCDGAAGRGMDGLGPGIAGAAFGPHSAANGGQASGFGALPAASTQQQQQQQQQQHLTQNGADAGGGAGAGVGGAGGGGRAGAGLGVGAGHQGSRGGEERHLQDEEEGEELKVPVSVEVCLRSDACASARTVADAVTRFLEGRTLWYRNGPLDLGEADSPLLLQQVLSVSIADADPGLHRLHSPLLFWQYTPHVYVYQLSDEGPVDDDEGEEGAPSYREQLLPATDLAGQWEALQFDSAIQQRLLSYATSALLFADRGVDGNLVAWNRVVLLYGPPGTGKTSLCKALAQKLSIRLGDRYRQGCLVEVNAHSLFSKWFSESGKLVSRLFSKIGELVEEPDSLVFVLIDEVESLTSARKAAVAGSEPSDAIRAVNALLTQLDALRRHPNVMAIDVAFVDRADIKAYIGPPSLAARYEMLRASVQELSRAGIIADDTRRLLLPYADATDAAAAASSSSEPMHQPTSYGNGGGAAHMSDGGGGGGGSGSSAAAAALSCLLLGAAAACEGLSGRTLRKLPFLAHAGAPGLAAGGPGGGCSARRFLRALAAAAEREQSDRSQLLCG